MSDASAPQQPPATDAWGSYDQISATRRAKLDNLDQPRAQHRRSRAPLPAVAQQVGDDVPLIVT